MTAFSVTGGSLTSAPISAAPFDEMLPSWNAALPSDGTVILEVRVQLPSGNWSGWYSFGTWTPGEARQRGRSA
ncbi:hypothetical protein [Deinococcus soli (ex Cha et al. 2016)]|uniref:Uncharacterized protein n=2 Tax=Deinococcus soli (ex Cha et al. 2016) TaxID=1309411 RepID=A0AAE3XD31_9DEIO|nr:hypothetical protein [Deinococcus soli (ex Cha et al. 2016)]MDR6219222.1 hypothetical protein [Deinococcus soli (ex Cha et al. 2016)]MDR6329471.1 hypothetical protein [Deinococcus soli (ex Cha et al. 2016)]MDR6752131.1 hypothetical protein [Deinococcus soli (ex Cha et al. 2016)]